MADSIVSFLLERSTDGQNWSPLKTLPGNASSTTDPELPHPTWFYRLTGTTAEGFSVTYNTVRVDGPQTTSPGTLLWASATRGKIGGDNALVNNLVVDNQGNVIIAGNFKGSIDLGDGVFVDSTGGNTATDFIIIKYNSTGQYLWSKHIGSIFNDSANGVCVNDAGDIFVAGSFGGTVNFGGITKTAVSGTDIFVVRYPSNGGPAIWVNAYGCVGPDQNDQATCIACNSNGDIAVGGITGNSEINFGGGNLPAPGGQDGFVLKLSSTGNFLWANRLAGPGGDQVKGIAFDADNNVVVVGNAGGTSINLGNGSVPTHGSTNFFIAKYSGVDGHYIWANLIGSNRSDNGFGIACDRTSGPTRNRIIVTGSYQGDTNTHALDFGGISKSTNNGGTAIYVAVYGTAGNLIWVNSYGGEFNASDVGNAIAVDNAGNIVLTGSVQSAVDFGGGYTFGDGAQNYFALGLSSAGAWRWSTRVVGTGGGGAGGVGTDSSRNAITTGGFGNTINLGTQSNPVTVTTVFGSKEIFVAKYTN